jgi:hypothetical protein
MGSCADQKGRNRSTITKTGGGHGENPPCPCYCLTPPTANPGQTETLERRLDFLNPPRFIRKVVRPERFELPAFWFVARRSIQLSYGRISILLRSNSLQQRARFHQPRVLRHSKKKEKLPALKRAIHNLIFEFARGL